MTECKFKIGDKVRCIKQYANLKINNIYTITKIKEDNHFGEKIYLLYFDESGGWFHTNFEFVEESKPEFKVDKLGWYKDNNGDKYKVIYQINKHSFVLIDGYDTPQSVYYNGTVEGLDFILTEYLGPELPKEPRKFEFETTTKKEKCEITLKVNLEKCDIVPTCYYSHDTSTKWRIVMTEILED